MLTEIEKDLLREMLCDTFGANLNAGILKAYAEKTDDEIRAEIAEYKGKKAAEIDKTIAFYNGDIDRLIEEKQKYQ